MRSYKRVFADYASIAAGALLLALALNLFLVPCKLSTGGASTTGTILLYLFRIPLSVTNLALNALLLIWGYKYIGKAAVIKTLAGIVFLSAFLELTRFLPVYTDDLLLAALIGGIFSGVGIGLVVRREASTGGSDFAALLLNRFFPYISVATFILAIDCVIIAIAGLVFQSLTVSLYSAIALFVSTRVTDRILTRGDAAKSVYILSSKSERIAADILKNFARGMTGLYGKGMYSDKDRLMLLCVVSPKELPALVQRIRSIDKAAFIVISDAREVLGEGFKSASVYDRQQSG